MASKSWRITASCSILAHSACACLLAGALRDPHFFLLRSFVLPVDIPSHRDCCVVAWLVHGFGNHKFAGVHKVARCVAGTAVLRDPAQAGSVGYMSMNLMHRQ